MVNAVFVNAKLPANPVLLKKGNAISGKKVTLREGEPGEMRPGKSK
jgi:hypothetical protein